MKQMRLLFLLTLAILGCGPGCALVDKISGEGVRREIRRIGEPAEALVVRLWDTGKKVNDDPIVGLELEVYREGVEPYRAETTARVPLIAIPQVQPGQLLPIRYDPNDPGRVALDIYEGDY